MSFTHFVLSQSFYRTRRSNIFRQTIHQIMEPLSLVILLLHIICWIIGGAFILGAIVRYLQHRYNPAQTPLDQPFFLGFLGLVLILLPFATRYAL